MAASVYKNSLATLLSGIVAMDAKQESSFAEVKVSGLTLDSRRAKPGDVYLACAGTTVHGEVFIDDAISAGVVAVLREVDAAIPSIPLSRRPSAQGPGIPILAVPGLSQKVARLRPLGVIKG